MNDSEPVKYKTLLVDDHKMVLDGLRMILSREKQIELVGEAYDGKQALEFLHQKQVDLVITDINMPEMSGTELTHVIKSEFPEIKTLILTVDSDSEVIHEILLAEAEGYILKNSGKQELLKAIERISSGGTYYSNEVLTAVTGRYVKTEKVREETKSLTTRELEIIRLICQELTTQEIAERLFISPLTVETHRKNILRKTRIKTLVGLIKYAIQNEIADLS